MTVFHVTWFQPRRFHHAFAFVLALVMSGIAPALQAAEKVAAEPRQDTFHPFVDLLEVDNALVTVRFVVRVQMPGVDQEAENEITCVSIDPRGLMLCSATELGGYFSVMARYMGHSDASVSAAPTDLRVTFKDGSQHAADLIARDSDRDLAWLMVRDLAPEATLESVEFGAHGDPSVGAPLYVLRRLGPYFGSVPVVSEARISATIERPRRLIVPSTPGHRLGMPVFDATGRPLGLVVAQVPGNDDSRAVLELRSRNLPGQPGSLHDMIGGLILPAADIVRATELALELWAEDQRDVQD